MSFSIHCHLKKRLHTELTKLLGVKLQYPASPQVVGKLVGKLVSWLVGWLVSWLVCWSVGWLVGKTLVPRRCWGGARGN